MDSAIAFWRRICGIIFWLMLVESSIMLGLTLNGLPWVTFMVVESGDRVIDGKFALQQVQYCNYKDYPEEGFCIVDTVNNFFQSYQYKCETKGMHVLMLVAFVLMCLLVGLALISGAIRIVLECHCVSLKMSTRRNLRDAATAMVYSTWIRLLALSIAVLWIGGFALWFATHCMDDVSSGLTSVMTSSSYDVFVNQTVGFYICLIGLVSFLSILPLLSCGTSPHTKFLNQRLQDRLILETTTATPDRPSNLQDNQEKNCTNKPEIPLNQVELNRMEGSNETLNIEVIETKFAQFNPTSEITSSVEVNQTEQP